jgi:hypothetical protein
VLEQLLEDCSLYKFDVSSPHLFKVDIHDEVELMLEDSVSGLEQRLEGSPVGKAVSEVFVGDRDSLNLPRICFGFPLVPVDF